MNKITFPPNVDDATKARTEEFYEKRENAPFVTNFLQRRALDAELATLVKQGICLEAKDTCCFTPLISAVLHGCMRTVLILVAAGADLEARNWKDSTALCWASSGDHGLYGVKALVVAGANIETRDEEGKTPLLHAAWRSEPSIFRFLFKKGANIYAQDKEGKNALNERIGLAEATVIELSQRKYDQFVSDRHRPASVDEVYQLLACTPLINPKASVDYVGNLRRIFAHANWQEKMPQGFWQSKQGGKMLAAGILQKIQKDGLINAETVESILAATFPPERIRRAQTQLSGMAI